jgi:regulator of RNase E activity RraA
MSNLEVTKSVLERLKEVATPTVLGFLRRKGYGKVFMEHLRPLTPGQRLAARARTLRFLPTRPDLRDEVTRGEHSPIYKAMELCGSGDALVVDAMRLPYACIGGDVRFLQLKMNGAEGIVTDGGIRDVPTIKAYGLVVYAANPTPKAGPSDMLFYDWDLPIQCGGALVRPGDVLVGDEAGVVVIPAAMAEEAAGYAEEHEEAEEFVKELIEKEGCNPGRYYPIDDETMRLFKEAKGRDS